MHSRSTACPRCQRTYQHAVPKVARAEPRIAIMFRPTWEE